MKKNINIAIVGLGQIGNFLYNQLKTQKKDIKVKTGKSINIKAISAKNINKKRKFSIDKKIFFKKPLDIFKKKKNRYFIRSNRSIWRNIKKSGRNCT